MYHIIPLFKMKNSITSMIIWKQLNTLLTVLSHEEGGGFRVHTYVKGDLAFFILKRELFTFYNKHILCVCFTCLIKVWLKKR